MQPARVYPLARRPQQPSLAPGFTLVEVMVVVVILSILAALVVPQIMGKPDEARITKAQQDLRAIEASLNLYKLDNFNYPSTDEGLEALVNPPADAARARNWKGPYLKSVPKDPWGNEYLYLSPGEQGAIDVYSLGADGEAGGEGTAADIGNWQLQ